MQEQPEINVKFQRSTPAVQQYDPVTLEVLANLFASVAEEMSEEGDTISVQTPGGGSWGAEL